MSKSPEAGIFDPTPLEYPRGYFEVQHAFATRIAELGIAPLQVAVAEYTAINRRLEGTDPEKLVGVWESPEKIWDAYEVEPSHAFKPAERPNDGCHHGSFIYKPYPDKKLIIDDESKKLKIDLHFDNHRGPGKSEYSREFIPRMTADLRQLFQAVADRMKAQAEFKPEWVTMGSWMNNFRGVQLSMPQEFAEGGIILRPPRMSFKGDSLWGQFLTNNGGVNNTRYRLFVDQLPNCNNLDQLVDAFPVPVMFSRLPIDIYFKFYGTRI